MHNIGCMGKITAFKETDKNRFLIDLKGIIRFEIIEEIKTDKKYRECKVNFKIIMKILNLKKKI